MVLFPPHVSLSFAVTLQIQPPFFNYLKKKSFHGCLPLLAKFPYPTQPCQELPLDNLDLIMFVNASYLERGAKIFPAGYASKDFRFILKI